MMRPASSDDLDLLVTLTREFWAEDGHEFDDTEERRALVELLFDPRLGEVWMIEDRGESVGFGVVTFGFSLLSRGHDAYIDEIYIRPAARGRGLGKEAMAKLESTVRAKGARALHLEVAEDNIDSQALYGKFGFRKTRHFLMTKSFDDQS